MLTASQCEVVAFVTEGEIICKSCALEEYGEGAVAAAEEGFESGFELSPLIRYSVDEYSGERQYDEAEYRLREWEDEHPLLAATIEERRWELLDWLAEKQPGEHCGSCYQEL